ncbi:hypothetical protein C8F04DRAFT_1258963 [Mycena alexandri]|uniref:Uncharacterized protein n=1 Tax=Mycena alexandri TaxID=1745969 RepID=A0AAD6SX24_9AGAR|nr:hypothetical protein C8F04DRAFT_1258963 [Mycena alexandri]
MKFLGPISLDDIVKGLTALAYTFSALFKPHTSAPERWELILLEEPDDLGVKYPEEPLSLRTCLPIISPVPPNCSFPTANQPAPVRLVPPAAAVISPCDQPSILVIALLKITGARKSVTTPASVAILRPHPMLAFVEAHGFQRSSFALPINSHAIQVHPPLSFVLLQAWTAILRNHTLSLILRPPHALHIVTLYNLAHRLSIIRSHFSGIAAWSRCQCGRTSDLRPSTSGPCDTPSVTPVLGLPPLQRRVIRSASTTSTHNVRSAAKPTLVALRAYPLHPQLSRAAPPPLQIPFLPHLTEYERVVHRHNGPPIAISGYGGGRISDVHPSTNGPYATLPSSACLNFPRAQGRDLIHLASTPSTHNTCTTPNATL